MRFRAGLRRSDRRLPPHRSGHLRQSRERRNGETHPVRTASVPRLPSVPTSSSAPPCLRVPALSSPPQPSIIKPLLKSCQVPLPSSAAHGPSMLPPRPSPARPAHGSPRSPSSQQAPTLARVPSLPLSSEVRFGVGIDLLAERITLRHCGRNRHLYACGQTFCAGRTKISGWIS